MKINCPTCKKERDVDDSSKRFICSNCGTKFILGNNKKIKRLSIPILQKIEILNIIAIFICIILLFFTNNLDKGLHESVIGKAFYSTVPIMLLINIIKGMKYKVFVMKAVIEKEKHPFLYYVALSFYLILFLFFFFVGIFNICK